MCSIKKPTPSPMTGRWKTIGCSEIKSTFKLARNSKVAPPDAGERPAALSHSDPASPATCGVESGEEY